MKHPFSSRLVGILIAVLFCIPATPVLADHPTPHITNPVPHATGNPLNITITTTTIRSLDKNLKNPSFQVTVLINGESYQSPIWKNTPYVYEPWTTTYHATTADKWINITMLLTDTNTGKLCDLSPCHEQSDKYNDTVANLNYNTWVGHWVGDDYAFWWDEGHDGNSYDIYPSEDPSGYGHLNGCDDGSINQHDNDAELYFTITQDTPAPDGIPYWVKTAIYHLNATTDYTGYDPNGDGIPLTYDWLWGTDPFGASNAAADPDNDGLNTTKELRVSQWGSDPYHPDIYVELDHMADSPRGEKSNLPQESKEMIRTSFAQHNYELHIDDGSMGGGEVIPFQENLSWDTMGSVYLNYFLHGNLSNWRRGIFRYGVVVYEAGYAGYNFWNGVVPYFDCFQISSKRVDKKVIPSTLHKQALAYGSVYMHELGHNIGLNDFAGIDNQQNAFPWMKDWWKFLPYKSCMNYAYTYNLIGYSDGRHGKNDYDDWGHFNLPRFQEVLQFHHHP